MKTNMDLLKSTILAILIFFSISFLTVLFQINSPLNRVEGTEMNIGFPFVYYNQFMVNCPIPNSGWNIINLLIDWAIIWILTVTGYKLTKKNALQHGV